MGKKVLYLIVAAFGFLAFYSSCANMGNPSGGPKDTIPPVVIKSEPAPFELNVGENKVRLFFDEFVITDELNDKFVISPPIEKRPTFKTKGKSLIIDLREELKDSTTYSLDFKDAIVDNNEKNPLRDLRLAFSTGETLDSLRMVGYVKDAFSLEPVENAYVLLYRNLSDTMVTTTRPDFIAKTNAEGFFAVTNLPEATYQVFTLTDNDNNLIFTPGAEAVSFQDSTITPWAEYIADRDTAITGSDTLVVFGKTRFYPDPIYFMQFEEEFFNLRLDDYQRPERKFIDLTFTASVADTFDFELLSHESKEKWSDVESTEDMDSIRIWLTDSNIYKLDTLRFRLTYQQEDTLGNLYPKNDTIKFYFSDKPQVKSTKRKSKKIVKKAESITLRNNLKGSGFDVYRDIIIESPEPVLTFDSTMVHIDQKVDTLFNPVPFVFKAHPANKRKFTISAKWDFNQTYRLTIDSSAVKTIYNMPSNLVDQKFKIQDEEHYGRIIVSLRNVKGAAMVQLLKNSEKEEVIRKQVAYEDGNVEFPYLEPQKYKMKIIFDRNDNGKWDTGNLAEKLQPEEVIYYPEVIKVRSNWDQNPTWELPTVNTYSKKIIDQEEEEAKAKQKAKFSTNKRESSSVR